MRVCPSCGEENPDKFRLCGFCGAALALQAPAPDVRKTVTIVFSDLKGSTALGERLDSEAVREVLDEYFGAMRTVLHRHGGLVEKYIGDAIMAVFGLPVVHEDDALRAVRAAHEMQAALAEVNQRLESRWGVRLENRTGVNTGEVVAGDPTTGQRLITGDTVNVAARLEQAAPALEVLIGEPTYRLVRDAVDVEAVPPLELKGKSERIPAYRLRGVTQGEGVARRVDTPLVGRTEELEVLTAALERTSVRRQTELVTLLAPAGTGKSRLLEEFVRGATGRARVLRGRCLSYGEGITFRPLAEIARSAAGIVDGEDAAGARHKLDGLLGDEAADVADRLAAVMGLSDAAHPVEETFWAARRLLESVARDRPVVAVIEDIHWAEPTFLDLIAHVVAGADGTALLLVCTARPELADLRPTWREDRPREHTITLRPLSAEESEQVVGNLLGEGALPGEPRRRIVEAAQGNPLFVEQMVSMMVDDGMIRSDGAGGWHVTGDLSSLAVPPSISALLTARLDRLAPTERAVMERSAVIGQTFYLGAVESLSPEPARAEVRPALESLIRRELVVAQESTLSGEQAFSFEHVLIRDAAYQGLLKRTRAELHEKFVEWLEGRGGDGQAEQDEIRGYHLEQTCAALAQLGPLDEHGQAVGARGAGYLASAGERARARGDMPAAASLLRRAAALTPEGAEAPRWLVHAGDALGEMAEFNTADEVLARAGERAEATGDQPLALIASVLRQTWQLLAAPEGSPVDEVAAAANESIAALERLEAHEGLARAWHLMMYVHFHQGRFTPAEDCVVRAIQEAELARDRVFEVRLFSPLASCVVYSRTPVAEALERCQHILERGTGNLRTEAMILAAMSHLEAMRGEAARARELHERSRAMLTRLGLTLSAATTSLDSGPAEMLSGDLRRAEAELRGDYLALRALGERSYLPSVAGLLAEVLHAQGRDVEAAAMAEVCRDSAAPQDVGSQYQWRSVRAKLLAAAGNVAEAEPLAREAVRLIRTTDQPNAQGDALAGLAEVRLAAGAFDEAADALREAVALFEAKGNEVSAGRARQMLAAVVGLPVPHAGELMAPVSA